MLYCSIPAWNTHISSSFKVLKTKRSKLSMILSPCWTVDTRDWNVTNMGPAWNWCPNNEMQHSWGVDIIASILNCWVNDKARRTVDAVVPSLLARACLDQQSRQAYPLRWLLLWSINKTSSALCYTCTKLNNRSTKASMQFIRGCGQVDYCSWYGCWACFSYIPRL